MLCSFFSFRERLCESQGLSLSFGQRRRRRLGSLAPRLLLSRSLGCSLLLGLALLLLGSDLPMELTPLELGSLKVAFVGVISGVSAEGSKKEVYVCSVMEPKSAVRVS